MCISYAVRIRSISRGMFIIIFHLSGGGVYGEGGGVGLGL